uniref:Exonuclease V n=1 Tax=Kalanchoe fedtschenkoi TaxID=63787 RepID=A0A7N0R8K3_KALFE
MAESETESTHRESAPEEPGEIPPLEIPIEIVSEEEMAFIETALALATASFGAVARSAASVAPVFAKRRLSRCSSGSAGVNFSGGVVSVSDIEDSGGGGEGSRKKIRVGSESLLDRFRRRKGLSVTDFTAAEWCEKQTEYGLVLGRQRPTKAMKAGLARHTELEEEVVKRVKVDVKSVEDTWALRLMNFIVGAQQLVLEGLTRELPVLGCIKGVWVVGIIDELRMPLGSCDNYPTLVDTKTRKRDSLPAEPQRRNGRLQLMCYKYLWDNQIMNEFPSTQLFNFFSLDPHCILSDDIQETTANSGYEAKTLDDVLRSFRTMCSMLRPAQDKLLLRYEFQDNNSLILEDSFDYDDEWVKSNIQQGLEFWRGEREANYAPEDERWKCRFCGFSSVCPINNPSPVSPQPSQVPQPDSSAPQASQASQPDSSSS